MTTQRSAYKRGIPRKKECLFKHRNSLQNNLCPTTGHDIIYVRLWGLPLFRDYALSPYGLASAALTRRAAALQSCGGARGRAEVREPHPRLPVLRSLRGHGPHEVEQQGSHVPIPVLIVTFTGIVATILVITAITIFIIFVSLAAVTLGFVGVTHSWYAASSCSPHEVEQQGSVQIWAVSATMPRATNERATPTKPTEITASHTPMMIIMICH